MQAALDWLSSLPPAALYSVLALVAALENVFPPLPADTVVAFGSFLAARGQGSAAGAFLSTWAGNIAGAVLMYWVGRRYGADFVQRRLLGKKGPGAQERLEALYGRYGILALVISRFLPGIRAIVPPFAGSLRVPAVIALPAIALASGVWYGLIAVVAFRAGENWEDVQAAMARQARVVALVAIALAAIGLLVWWVRRRRTP
jgi:membrane protein DedA with SNARE-associated domain